jgi:hypothetical protein
MSSSVARALLLTAFVAVFSAAAGAQPALTEQATDISPAELARRQTQAEEAADCRKTAREQKGTRASREAARLECEATFREQRSTWNDKSRQLP